MVPPGADVVDHHTCDGIAGFGLECSHTQSQGDGSETSRRRGLRHAGRYLTTSTVSSGTPIAVFVGRLSTVKGIAAITSLQTHMNHNMAFRTFLVPRFLSRFLPRLRFPFLFCSKPLFPRCVSLEHGALGMDAIARVG